MGVLALKSNQRENGTVRIVLERRDVRKANDGSAQLSRARFLWFKLDFYALSSCREKILHFDFSTANLT